MFYNSRKIIPIMDGDMAIIIDYMVDRLPLAGDRQVATVPGSKASRNYV